MFVNYQQDDWSDWLPFAEFAYNNSTHSATKQSPFYTLYGRHPVFQAIHTDSLSSASTYLENINRLQEELRTNLEKANERYKIFANQRRLEPLSFKIGDQVWLSSTNIKRTRLTTKLSEKKLGTFEINSMVSKSSFQLKLPSSWKIHPVFHVSLLKPAKGPYPGKAHPRTTSSNGRASTTTPTGPRGNLLQTLPTVPTSLKLFIRLIPQNLTSNTSKFLIVLILFFSILFIFSFSLCLIKSK